MNMIRKNGGFTLVELIVVIAILAILAGVAIPAYSGYIAKANDAAVLSELVAIETAAQAACSMNGTTPTTITVSKAGVVKVTAKDPVEQADVDKDFASFYATDTTTLGNLISKHSKVTDSGATWTAATDSAPAGWDILKSASN